MRCRQQTRHQMALIEICPNCGVAISLVPSDLPDPVAVSKPTLPVHSPGSCAKKNPASEPTASSAGLSQAASKDGRIPQALRTPPWIFKSPDYIPLVPASPAQIAAAELAARLVFYKDRPPTPLKNFELRHCLPAPRTSAYSDLRTGELVILRRERGTSSFSKLTSAGWTPLAD